MKRLVTAILGASISAATFAAPLVSASATAPSVAVPDNQFCAADFGYDSISGLTSSGAGAAMPALTGAKSEVDQADEVTAATVHMVRNIRLAGSSDPSPIVAVGSTVFFAATGQGGRELWKSDGTEAGTKRVKDIKPGGGSSNPNDLVAAGSLLFFTADDGAHGRELFVSDGTSAGTRLVKDIKSGVGSSEPSALANINGTLYFSADGSGGRELWKSDGTAAGTRRVKDLRVGPKGSNPTEIISVGSTIYFSAFDKAANERQIWRSDGSAAGTYPLAADDYYRDARSLVRVGSLVYFVGDSSGCAPSTYLIRTDGTAEGTFIVANASGEDDYGNPMLTSSLKNRLLVAEYGKLKKVNLAENNLALVKDFENPLISDEAIVVDMRRMGSKLYLTVDLLVYDESSSQVIERQLWASDGTSSGTVMVASWAPMYVVPMLTVLNTELFFWSAGSDGPDIWRTDGTTAGTVLAAEVHAPFEQYLTAAGNSLYFSHDDGTHGRELWRLVP